MSKQQTDTGRVNLPSFDTAGQQWDWNDESQTLEFVSWKMTSAERTRKYREKLNNDPARREEPKGNTTAEDLLRRRRRRTKGNINDHLRSDRFSLLNGRGRQITRNNVNQSHLIAYKSSVNQSQRAHVSIEDVKQVAVNLLLEKSAFPIPHCFMAVLKSKELDDFLATLLLYLSCFFEKMLLEKKPKPLMAVQGIKERQAIARTSAKVELAQKKLAVCYAELIMSQRGESRVPSTHTDRQLYECLYSFFCYVAWVTFGRKDLRVIQEEVGRLLRSDTFNPALRNKPDEDPGEATLVLDGSVTEGQADINKTQGPSTAEQRKSQKRPALCHMLNQRSPLMVSLLPLPREQSPHLFVLRHSSRARRLQSSLLLQAGLVDTGELTEELNQQLVSLSLGILGKPLSQFSHTTLMPRGAKGKDGDEEGEEDYVYDNKDTDEDPGIRDHGSKASFMRMEPSARHGSTGGIDTEISRATTEAVSLGTE